MFGRLFGSKKTLQEDKEFTLAFDEAFRRYLSLPDADISYSFKDKRDNVMPPSVAFAGTYQEWKGIQSVWDRRGVIFAALDDVYLRELSKAQVLERFIIDRYPQKAMEIAEKHETDADRNNPDYLASLARCHFFLANHEQSVAVAKQALSLAPDHKKASIALADSLHLLGRHKEAHAIYEQILTSGKMNEWPEETISVLDIVGFQSDILNSSVYAVGLLTSGESDEAMWNAVAGEFYHCPYFRSQHAFWLLEKGESMKGMIKLMMTAQEFPQFKDAVVNARSGILQVREQMNAPDLWAEEFAALNATMEERGWS